MFQKIQSVANESCSTLDILDENLSSLQDNVQSSANDQLLSEPYHVVSEIKDRANQNLGKLNTFTMNWNTYEELMNILQPWLTQTEKDGGGDLTPQRAILLQSEFETYDRMFAQVCDHFAKAINSCDVQDEDLQRQLFAQFEQRWKALEKKLKDQVIEMPQLDLEDIKSTIQTIGDVVENPSFVGTEEETLSTLQKNLNMKKKLTVCLQQLQNLVTKGELKADEAEQVGTMLPMAKRIHWKLDRQADDLDFILKKLLVMRQNIRVIEKEVSGHSNQLEIISSRTGRSKDELRALGKKLTVCALSLGVL